MKQLDLVKSSLLLWDQVEFIVPDEQYRPNYDDRSVAEAIELLGVMHHPNLDEKRQAHRKIEGMFVDELARLQPTAGYMRLLKDSVVRVWKERQATVQADL